MDFKTERAASEDEREEIDEEPEEIRERPGTSDQEIPHYGNVTTPTLRTFTKDIMPRAYDGKTSWRTYRGYFERVAHVNKWEPRDRMDFLWISLAGMALTFVEGLAEEQKRSYDQLCGALDARFGAERLKTIHKAELLSRKRKDGESLGELGQAIRKLVSCAYPEFPLVAQEEIAVERFLDALEKPAMRMAIHQAEPENLDQAVEKGLQMEAWETADQQKHGVTKVRAAVEDEQLRMIKGLEEKFDKWQKTTPEMPIRKCYSCG